MQEVDEVGDETTAAYANGNYSPVYVCDYQIDLGTIVISDGEEVHKRQADQDRALRGNKVESVMNAEEKALEREAKRGMTDDEAMFSVETALESHYEWSDKYRPRKPRYVLHYTVGIVLIKIGNL